MLRNTITWNTYHRPISVGLKKKKKKKTLDSNCNNVTARTKWFYGILPCFGVITIIAAKTLTSVNTEWNSCYCAQRYLCGILQVNRTPRVGNGTMLYCFSIHCAVLWHHATKDRTNRGRGTREQGLNEPRNPFTGCSFRWGIFKT